MEDRPALVLSLDLELGWGLAHSSGGLGRVWERLKKTRYEVLPRLLELLVQRQLQATWAVVGMLGLHDADEARELAPELLPSYHRSGLNSYGLLEQRPWHEVLFAPEIIPPLLDAPGQELASHSFSHYHCLERGPQPSDFRADLQAAQEAAARWGVKHSSLVFPGNQYDAPHLKIARELGFRSFRGNPPGWSYAPRSHQGQHLLLRLTRLLDAHWPTPTLRQPSPPLPQGLCDIPASRFLRPVGRLASCNRRRLQRILDELDAAARPRGLYHLWWHPHNFGSQVEENFAFLTRILDHIKRLQDERGLRSLTMAQLSQTTPL